MYHFFFFLVGREVKEKKYSKDAITGTFAYHFFFSTFEFGWILEFMETKEDDHTSDEGPRNDT